jgi:hypothetical protein
MALLRKHKSLVPVGKLPQILHEHPEESEKLLELLLKESHLSPTASCQSNTSTHTIIDTLRILHDRREQGDFEIQISGTEIAVKCHAFVIQTRWPYARIMLSSVNFEDVVKHRMKFPPPGEEGGLHKGAIEAMLDLLYLGNVRPETLSGLSPAAALTITSNIDLYFSSMDHPALFRHLIQSAETVLNESVTAGNCLELYQVATGIGATQAIEHAKEVFVQNFTAIWEDTAQQERLFALEPAVRERLLWASMAAIAKIQQSYFLESTSHPQAVDSRRARYGANHDI